MTESREKSIRVLKKAFERKSHVTIREKNIPDRRKTKSKGCKMWIALGVVKKIIMVTHSRQE